MTFPIHIKWALAIAIFLWASAFVGIRAGLQAYSPEGLALLRYLIASLCMGIVYYRLPQRSTLSLLDIAGLLGVGVLGIGIYNLMLNYGELYVSSGMASFIISQSPIITAMFAFLFLGESISATCLMGFLISVMGVLCIAMGSEGGFKWEGGIFFILAATVASGFFSLLQKPFLKKCHAIEATTYIIWGGTLFLLIYTPQMQHDLVNAPWMTTSIVVYLGIFPAAIGYVAWSYVLSAMPASRAVSFLYFMPFLATVLGFAMLGEVPTWLSILGGVLAMLGVWLVNHAYTRQAYSKRREVVEVECTPS
jgi:drug/metabolite transporter (DMT)-like permease